MEKLIDQARQALHPGSPSDESRALRNLFDNLPALVAYWDADCRNKLSNAAYVEFFGRSPDQILGRHISEILGPDVYAKNLPYITAVLAGERQDFDRTLIDSHGQVRHTQATYIPDVVEGTVRGFFVLVAEVTARVELERDRDEAQSIAGMASWTWRPDDDVATWSPEMYRLIDKEPGSFPPSYRAFLPIIHPDDQEIAQKVVAEAVATGDPYEARWRLIRGDEIRHVVSRGRPVSDSEGRVVLVRGTISDETEERLASERLFQLNTRLTRANELLEDTMSMLSHDIRQPLTAVQGFSEHLCSELSKAGLDTFSHYADRIRAAANRMSRLVADVLSVTMAGAERLSPRASDIEVPAMLAEVRHELLDVVSGTDPATVVVAKVDDQTCVATADEAHVRQALINLGTNALRYGRPPVIFSARCAGDSVLISVRDHGSGVPPEAQARLFERFVRGESAGDTPGSTGFGLYLSRRLAEVNGGTLEHDDTVGPGTCFTLSLPRATVPELQPPEETRPAAEAAE